MSFDDTSMSFFRENIAVWMAWESIIPIDADTSMANDAIAGAHFAANDSAALREALSTTVMRNVSRNPRPLIIKAKANIHVKKILIIHRNVLLCSF